MVFQRGTSRVQNAETDEEADLDESDLDEVDLDEVDLDEVDLDSEEIDLVGSNLDMDSTEEFIVAQDAPMPEVTYSRRESFAPKKSGPTAVIVAAHAVIILAALCIFHYKNKQSAGGYDRDYEEAVRQDYVTESNTAARVVENTVRRLGLPCRIVEIEKDSPASPEARVVVRKKTYDSKEQLRKTIEAAAVKIGSQILHNDQRVRTVRVVIQARLSGGLHWDTALAVTFEREKVKRSLSGRSPQDILAFFGAQYHSKLTQN